MTLLFQESIIVDTDQGIEHGRSAEAADGLSQAEPKVSALRASIPSAQDFQPESYEGKPRHIPKPERELLRSFIEPCYDRIEAMTLDERAVLISACMNVSPINCGWDEYAAAKLLVNTAIFDQTVAFAEARAASAIEAGTAETVQQGSVHESAVPQGDAPTPGAHP
jgi:hypothetical protein